MATQVPQTNTPLPMGRRPEQASPALEKPVDYKETFKVCPSACPGPAQLTRRTAARKQKWDLPPEGLAASAS
jgi:hypothetical protein